MLLKKGRFTVLLVSLILPVSMTGQQGKDFRYLLEGNLGPRFSIDSRNSILIDYSLPEIIFRGVSNSHGDFYRISVPGHTSTSEAGKPELPVYSRLIAIPDGSRPVVTISSVKSRKLNPGEFSQKGLLFPRQADAAKNDQQERDFLIDRKEYSKKSLIKSDTVSIETIGTLRHRKLAVIHISPLRYNPCLNELELITSMKITASFTGGSEKSGTIPAFSSPMFDKTVAKAIVNYYPEGFINGFSTKPVGMVIVTDSAFRKALKPFITWKTQQGFRITTLYKGTYPGSDTYAGIKDTLTSIYRSGTEAKPAPEYLLIVGDVSRIPLADGTYQVSDMYYGEFDGNGDYVPDMFIGRLPVPDTTSLKNVVEKLLQYEKYQFADSNHFYSGALVSAGNDGGYDTYMNGQVNYASSYYINASNGLDGHIFNYPASAGVAVEDSIKKLINNGLSFINYTGHGDVSGWLDPSIKASDVSQLHNKGMYPFIITNACQTAHFNASSSLGNTMVIAGQKGAIGYIGCSNDSYWDEDYYWSVGVCDISSNPKYGNKGLGAYDRLFHLNGEKPADWYTTMGMINYAGNLSVSSSTSPRKKYYWETYTLLGDPSATPIIGKPDSLSIQIPSKLPKGITSYSMITDPFAYIAVSAGDSLIDASFVSPDGSVTIRLPGNRYDSCLVVATGQNKIPFIKKIYFNNVSDEFVNLNNNSINDSTGNNNGKADFDETFWLDLTIENLGMTASDSMIARITTNSNLIKFLSDSLYIGSLAGNSRITIPRAMEIKVADSIPDKAVIPVDLIIKDKVINKRYRIDIMVHSPDFRIISCYIDDTGVGNGNFIPEPGEKVNLVYRIMNSGSSSTPGNFTISSQGNNIQIDPPGAKSEVFPSDDTLTLSMPVTLSVSAKPGDYFTVSSYLSCSPYDVSRSFDFRIGKARESFELRSYDIYPWINVSAKPWTITGQDAYDGLYSARSGKISNNESTRLIIKLSLTAEDTLRFYCRVSSEEYYDFLTFRLNGTTVFRMSGESGWVKKTVVLPAGLNTLEWEYSKDEAVSDGLDCAFLDLVDFPDPAEVVFIDKDLSVDRIIQPVAGSDITGDSVVVKVSNQGKDPVNGFNLQYSVNNIVMNPEHFDNVLSEYLDSATISFSQKQELSKFNNYSIKVFSVNNPDDFHGNDTAAVFIKIVVPFRAYPNPFRDNLTLVITADEPETVTVSMISSSGIKVRGFSYPVVMGENNIGIDCTGLPAGYYFLSVRGKNINRTNSLVKVK
ncbi:MAG TPA: C25 family cysteine peptidase [Bacteroidales bacterium]|nr:C25 family cysteine peptidase [Bacteroidales bacterium]